MKGHVERLAPPLRQSALLTPVLLEPLVEEALLEVAAIRFPANDEQSLDRHHPRAGLDIAALHRAPPGVLGESEAALTLVQRDTGVVCGSNLGPVVATREPAVDRLVQPPNVEANRALGDSEPSCDLRPRIALREERTNRCSRLARRPLGPCSLSARHEHMFPSPADGNAAWPEVSIRTGGGGFEPPFPGPEPGVVPLDHPPTGTKNIASAWSSGTRRDSANGSPRDRCPHPPARPSSPPPRPPPR
jgi:hypothetical protein